MPRRGGEGGNPKKEQPKKGDPTNPKKDKPNPKKEQPKKDDTPKPSPSNPAGKGTGKGGDKGQDQQRPRPKIPARDATDAEWLAHYKARAADAKERNMVLCDMTFFLTGTCRCHGQFSHADKDWEATKERVASLPCPRERYNKDHSCRHNTKVVPKGGRKCPFAHAKEAHNTDSDAAPASSDVLVDFCATVNVVGGDQELTNVTGTELVKTVNGTMEHSAGSHEFPLLGFVGAVGIPGARSVISGTQLMADERYLGFTYLKQIPPAGTLCTGPTLYTDTASIPLALDERGFPVLPTTITKQTYNTEENETTNETNEVH